MFNLQQETITMHYQSCIQERKHLFLYVLENEL